MKIYKYPDRAVVEFGFHETAHSRRTEGWPIWAGYPVEKKPGTFRVARVAYTDKRQFTVDVTGATHVVVPYVTNSGRTSYTFVRLSDRKVIKVHLSYENEVRQATQEDSFIRAFLHHITVEGGEAWGQREVTITDPEGSVIVEEVKL